MSTKKKIILPKGWKPLHPIPPTEPVVSRGLLQYSERRRGKSVLVLKREIIQELPELCDRTAKIHYEIELHRNQPRFQERVNELLRERRHPPFLLSLFNVKQEEET